MKLLKTKTRAKRKKEKSTSWYLGIARQGIFRDSKEIEETRGII
jgi:hypothetical protein